MAFDVLVVGAGVEGSATAYQLIKHGEKRVLLLEQVKIKNNLYYFNLLNLSNPPHYSTCPMGGGGGGSGGITLIGALQLNCQTP
jgi:choline dehydrogenase-like flavoprotein